MLTTDLDGDDEKDKGALDNLLAQLIAELCMDKKVPVSPPSLCSLPPPPPVAQLGKVIRRRNSGTSCLRKA